MFVSVSGVLCGRVNRRRIMVGMIHVICVMKRERREREKKKREKEIDTRERVWDKVVPT